MPYDTLRDELSCVSLIRKQCDGEIQGCGRLDVRDVVRTTQGEAELRILIQALRGWPRLSNKHLPDSRHTNRQRD